MKLSYEGIGQWAATFACDDLAEGELVKVSANGTVAACAAGDDFCGMVLSVGRGGDACAVALGGMVTAGYTVPAEGAAPALGWSGLSADGEGGVQADAAAEAFPRPWRSWTPANTTGVRLWRGWTPFSGS